jgi:hypothetical protein
VGWSDLGCAMENLWAVSMGCGLEILHFCYHRSFAYTVELSTLVWNNLDKNLKDSASFKIFKTALKHFLAKENV